MRIFETLENLDQLGNVPEFPADTPDPLGPNGDMDDDAALVDLRWRMSVNEVWLLFDLRQSWTLGSGNIALMVFRDVVQVNFSSFEDYDGRREGRTWNALYDWNLDDGKNRDMDLQEGGSAKTLHLKGCRWRDGRIRYLGGSAVLVGTAHGYPAAPPLINEGADSEVRAGMPHWCSDFTLEYGTLHF